MRGRPRSQAWALALLLALAGCGGAGSTSAPSAPTASATATPTPLAPGSPQLVRPVVDAVSQANWEKIVRELSGVDPITVGGRSLLLTSRDTATEGSRLAADHLQGVLAGLGYTVTTQDFTCHGMPSRNLVVSLPGNGSVAARVVLGAHYDCTNDRDAGNAPGADDNASGVAAVVEAARVLKGRSFTNPVDLVLFGAEEPGMCGSEHYLREARARGTSFRGAIVLDMIGYYDRHYELTIEGVPGIREWMDYPVEAVRTYTGLGSVQTFDSEDSDHVSFQDQGIPAYLLIESDWDHPNYHTAHDTFANLQPHFGYEATRATVATLAAAAGLVQ